LKETERARALGQGLELLKTADTGHYTQLLEEEVLKKLNKGSKISHFLHGLLSNELFSEI
jgi:hypothetical protein